MKHLLVCLLSVTCLLQHAGSFCFQAGGNPTTLAMECPGNDCTDECDVMDELAELTGHAQREWSFDKNDGRLCQAIQDSHVCSRFVEEVTTPPPNIVATI